MTGMEPWAISAVSGVAAMVFQSGGQALGVLGKTLDEKTKKLIFAASKQYEKNYEERHGILKVLGMREPVKLESIYTAVQFLGHDAIRSFESIENLEEVYRQAKSRSFQSHDGKKQAGIKVAIISMQITSSSSANKQQCGCRPKPGKRLRRGCCWFQVVKQQ
ncbi:hypothetical protein [Nostoc sp.]|uniref:hypothetical protein n=1 Tax=Nostoc sp. TaxID=1180 RepID=UPI002FFC919C